MPLSGSSLTPLEFGREARESGRSVLPADDPVPHFGDPLHCCGPDRRRPHNPSQASDSNRFCRQSEVFHNFRLNFVEQLIAGVSMPAVHRPAAIQLPRCRRSGRHSSGTPALRRPTKWVVSSRARVVGATKYLSSTPFTWAMLTGKSFSRSRRASARLTAARSKSPFKA
jgi:hypothetical protein